MKLLFMDGGDVFNAWGQLRFGATTLQRIGTPKVAREDLTPDFTVRCCIPDNDGTYLVYACDGGRGNTPWRIYRFRSPDGIRLEHRETVYAREPWRWAHVATVSYSPDREMFLCLKNTSEEVGFGMHAFFSHDGTEWRECDRNPVFLEGDRWGATWSSAVQRFLCFQKGIQRQERKRFAELIQDGRRVITLRSSPDGERWTPDTAAAYKQGAERSESGRMTRLGGPLVPVEHQILPDDLDPPDLEFYACTPFEHEGRYYLCMLNYAGAFVPPGTDPVSERGHGPNIDTEWWISRNGVDWSRPFRGINASEGGMIEHNPMAVDGRLLFHMRDGVYGTREDRLTYVTSRSNGVFETLLFSHPGVPLKLNASIPGDEYFEGDRQAYVMVEIIDDCDRPIPGFEREKCLLRPRIDSTTLTLEWSGNVGRELAGTNVRLRFYMRASHIYAVTA